MVILSTDLVQYLSGGAANTNPNLSLGGIISTTAVVDATLNNLFRNITGDEAAAGVVLYRGTCFKNTNATQDLSLSKIWIQSQTPAGDDVSIGLDPNGLNVTMETIANETTAPAGVTFSAPATKTAGLNTGNVPHTQFWGVWHKVNVPAGTTAYNNNNYVLTWEGDTPA